MNKFHVNHSRSAPYTALSCVLSGGAVAFLLFVCGWLQVQGDLCSALLSLLCVKIRDQREAENSN
jgi:hypothetical protein